MPAVEKCLTVVAHHESGNRNINGSADSDGVASVVMMTLTEGNGGGRGVFDGGGDGCAGCDGAGGADGKGADEAADGDGRWRWRR